MRSVIAVSLMTLTVSLGDISVGRAECSQHQTDAQKQSTDPDHSGLLAGVVRAVEKDDKIYDCTVYSSGEKCVLTGVVDRPEEPVQVGE